MARNVRRYNEKYFSCRHHATEANMNTKRPHEHITKWTSQSLISSFLRQCTSSSVKGKILMNYLRNLDVVSTPTLFFPLFFLLTPLLVSDPWLSSPLPLLLCAWPRLACFSDFSLPVSIHMHRDTPHPHLKYSVFSPTDMIMKSDAFWKLFSCPAKFLEFIAVFFIFVFFCYYCCHHFFLFLSFFFDK